MSVLLPVALLLIAFEASAQGSNIRWPNANIPVPPEVRTFIADECERYRGFSEESVRECVVAESYGYRAVVTMLVDPAYDDAAAERFRGCAAGLGDFGGRYHRRKAECLSKVHCIVWRYEFSWRASADRVSGDVERLALLGPEHILSTSFTNGKASGLAVE